MIIMMVGKRGQWTSRFNGLALSLLPSGKEIQPLAPLRPSHGRCARQKPKRETKLTAAAFFFILVVVVFCALWVIDSSIRSCLSTLQSKNQTP
jgi:hypothetical protein